MFNNNNKLVFNKLIEEIQGTFLERVISKYDGNFRSQHFDTKSHLYALLYSNFMNCKSLRELQTQISHNNKLKNLLLYQVFLNLVERMHLEIVGFLKIYFIILYLKLKSVLENIN